MNKVTHQAESTGTGAVLYIAIELSATKWRLMSGVGIATRVRHRTIAAGDVAALRDELRKARAKLGCARPRGAQLLRSGQGRLLGAPAAGERGRVESRDRFIEYRSEWAAAPGQDRSVGRGEVVPAARPLLGRRPRRLEGRASADGGSRGRAAFGAEPRHADRGTDDLAEPDPCAVDAAGRPDAIGADFAARLETVRDYAGQPLPAGLLARLRQAWHLLAAIETELRTARAAQRTEIAAAANTQAQMAAQLHRLQAIGSGTAALLAKELFSRDLQNRREVGALTGLVGVP